MATCGFDIDGKKLKAEIKKHDMRPADASRELGFNPNYFTNCASRGNIPAYAMNGLNSLLGIKLEDIKPDEPEEITEPTVETTTEDTKVGLDEFLAQHKVTFDLDYEKLNQVVWSAVYGAIKKASIDGWL